jgi:hypothetical protein
MAELKTIFSADSSGLRAEINKADRDIQQLGGKMRTLSFDKPAGGTSNFGAAIGRFVGWGAVAMKAGQAVRESFSQADVIENLADSIGMASGAIAALRTAAVAAGVPMEKMDEVLGRISAARFDALADGGSKAAESFQKMGIDIEKMGTVEGTVEAVGKALQTGAKDAEVMSGAMDIIGSRSVKLISTLKAVGVEGVDAMTERMKEAKEIMRDTSDLDALGDAFDAMWNRAVTGAGNAAAAIGKAIHLVPDRFDTENANLAMVADINRRLRAGTYGEKQAALPPPIDKKEEERTRITMAKQSMDISAKTDALTRIGGGRGIALSMGTERLTSIAERQLTALETIAASVGMRSDPIMSQKNGFLQMDW